MERVFSWSVAHVTGVLLLISTFVDPILYRDARHVKSKSLSSLMDL